MTDRLAHKLKWFRRITNCPLCDSFRTEVHFAEEHYGALSDVSIGYTPPHGAQAAIAFYCGSEIIVAENDEIAFSTLCHQIGREKAAELNAMAEESFADGDTLEDAT